MVHYAENRRARFDYEILNTYEAGIALLGHEVKSVKSGNAQLGGSYAIVRNNEVWLVNCDIPPHQPKNTPSEYDSKRTRRLLLHKKEIIALLGTLKSEKLTLIPLAMYNKKGKVKLTLGLGRGKKVGDKRETIRKRDVEREIQREARVR